MKYWGTPDRDLASLCARAEKGDAQAQRAMGCEYWWGEELPKDDVKSRYWYTLAAEQGHCEAMWDVATMYLDGEGGPKDVPRALEYMRRAASKRRWDTTAEHAANVLMQMYQTGCRDIIAPDAEQAKHWMRAWREQQRKYRGWRRRVGRRRR